MKIIERIKAKTSKDNRVKGQVKTTVGLICVTILSAGIVTNPIGITALTVGTIICGVSAGQHALKVE